MGASVAKHGRDHCPGGEDPIPCLSDGTDYAFMQWNGPEAVTVNTLSNPAVLGTPDVPYAEGFSIDLGVFDGGVDLTGGVIQSDNNGGWFLAEAWAQFNGGATVGSQLGVVLDFGTSSIFSTYRVGNSIIANAINEVFRIPVSRTWQRFGDFNHDSVRLLVWHDDAGGQDLNSAWLSVTYLSSSYDGTFV